MKIKYFNCILIVMFCIVALACNEDPPTQVIPILGKRDYTWTVDTLAYPRSFQTLMRSIWASSPKDVYVVGHNDQNGTGAMYHFDGVKWMPVKLLTREGGGIPTAPIDLYSVYGFAPNDVWAVGEHIYENPNKPPNFLDSSLIIHFDGARWSEVSIEKKRSLFAIAGRTSNRILAVGRNPSGIYHFINNKWILDTLPFNVASPNEFALTSVTAVSNNEFYALGSAHIDSIPKDIYYFFHYKNTAWSVVDSAIIEQGRYEYKWGYSKIWMSPWGKLYSVGLGVFVWENGSWVKILEPDRYLSGIYGTNENNIFVVGPSGRIYHWNGVDWCQLTSLPPSSFVLTEEWLFDVWTDGKEVFITGQDSQSRNTILLHGR